MDPVLYPLSYTFNVTGLEPRLRILSPALYH
ncbi:MAG: hypothetical protein QOK37_1677 [Thermoanaerobaculia bacterium]|nr:hypothetical protein [Thermoanaerobaculia bacterium]